MCILYKVPPLPVQLPMCRVHNLRTRTGTLPGTGETIALFTSTRVPVLADADGLCLRTLCGSSLAGTHARTHAQLRPQDQYPRTFTQHLLPQLGCHPHALPLVIVVLESPTKHQTMQSLEFDSLLAGMLNLYTRQASEYLQTEEISLVSNIHGRERRLERNISRVELQRAIKYGRKERANPGRDGSMRWRYTFDGVVYITDESSRHEITSWRLDGAERSVEHAEIALCGRGSHAILIVDNSGSMRKTDVPGYESRAHAVYDCLAKDFAKSQVQNGAAQEVVVTLISMSDDASVLVDKHPLDNDLVDTLKLLGKRRPRSHGNYLPSLDKALEIMREDAKNRANLLLLLLSDGAPSDHTREPCEHGVCVWEMNHKEEPFMGHSSQGQAWNCRKKLQAKIPLACRERIKQMGDIFGRDKVVVCTVAFGPPQEDFKVMRDMAEVLPRGSFHKLGLNAAGLRTAFSSLSSSMTELRTEGGGSSLTRRDKTVVKNQKQVEGDHIKGSDGYLIYYDRQVQGKYKYNTSTRGLQALYADGAIGLAFLENPFAEGAERFVHRCSEIMIPHDKYHAWYTEPWSNYDNYSMQVDPLLPTLQNSILAAQYMQLFFSALSNPRSTAADDLASQ